MLEFQGAGRLPRFTRDFPNCARGRRAPKKSCVPFLGDGYDLTNVGREREGSPPHSEPSEAKNLFQKNCSEPTG